MSELIETAQDFEAAWWGDCCNTFGEEAKQLTYAPRMGLVNTPREGKWPVYDLAGKSVLDIGGGPASMLLKTVNGGQLTVVDPCPYPTWVERRYDEAGIDWVSRKGGEDFRDIPASKIFEYDECWIYNVLQHVVDPEKVIETARAHAPLLRIFEWIETPPCDGHPHTLHAADLNAWIGGPGTVGYVDENGAVGMAYWGAFEL
jgi:2-polyprenyl-3-methyl-5-hydroxy-6-metoxy-1,4-benzoquinol methylase